MLISFKNKKIFFLILFVLLDMPIFAQNIYDLDEPSLLGRWRVTATEGIFVDECPIEFNLIEPYYDPNTKSMIYSWIKVDPNIHWPNFFGDGQLMYLHFMIGGSATGNYTLHLFPKTLTSNMKVVSFVFKKFTGDEMILTTYTGNGTIWLEKTNASVNAIEADEPKISNKTFNLKGQEIIEQKGVLIKDGKKYLVK